MAPRLVVAVGALAGIAPPGSLVAVAVVPPLVAVAMRLLAPVVRTVLAPLLALASFRPLLLPLLLDIPMAVLWAIVLGPFGTALVAGPVAVSWLGPERLRAFAFALGPAGPWWALLVLATGLLPGPLLLAWPRGRGHCLGGLFCRTVPLLGLAGRGGKRLVEDVCPEIAHGNLLCAGIPAAD